MGNLLSAISSGARAAIGWLRSFLAPALSYRPFLILLALGALLRIVVFPLYFPAVMMSFDTPRFARVDGMGLFDDYWMPAAYPAFLSVIHFFTAQVWVAIFIQHLIGLSLAVVVFLTLRRIRVPPAIACFPAAVFLFSGDLLYLEHILMADQQMFAFAVLSCCAAVRGLTPTIDRRWLAVAGVLGGFAFVTRSPGLVVITAVLLVTVLTVRFNREGLKSAACVLAGAAAVLVIYVGAFTISGQKYLGLSDMSGWNLYARVAPFADCTQFTPPERTRSLCETAPAAARPGVAYYTWDMAAPARQRFKQDPSTADVLNDFAIEAITAQPKAYADAVFTDLARYVEPSIGPVRGYSGQPRDLVSFGYREAAVEDTVVSGLEPKYKGAEVSAPGRALLSRYQTVFRFDRLLILLAAIATVIGLVILRGPLRIATALFGFTSFGLYLLPTMTFSYDFRYGIAPGAILAISGTLAIYGPITRRRTEL